MSPSNASIVLVDGEHYPAVVARAIAELKASGEHPVLALMVGGKEKLGQADADLGIPVEIAGLDREAALAGAIERTGVKIVYDMSDEPVLGYVARCRLASVAIWKGAVYKGADFEFSPPARPSLAQGPSVAVFGTGKRCGKTSIAGAAARAFKTAGLQPVTVAMGRGGPAEPEVLKEGVDLSPQALYEFVKQGRHAASDYIEDALTARIPTVGAWRAGGGLAGAPGFGNYEAALRVAGGLRPGILILEGSGSAIPPVRSGAGVLAVDARIDPGLVCGYFGLYRILLSDLIVLTMCEQSVDDRHLSDIERCIASCTLNQPTLIRTVFRPFPLGEISNKKVWFATTAAEEASNVLKHHLESRYGARVVGMTHALADRPQLLEDLKGAAGADALVVELKAAAVDLVTRWGIEHEVEVIYSDNRPVVVGKQGSFDPEVMEVAELAQNRFESR
ncbi:MAG: 2,3-diphosphoglycerate synthetase [Actinomycetota bacterium]